MPSRPTYDVLVAGAGPAGISAANAAHESGARVAVIDDNPAPGGQIWRGESHELRAEFIRADHLDFDYGKLILATGARELLLPVPGWTLPGVFAAGGLQALVKSGFDVRGKRVLVSGSGPLLLAVAAALRARGARIVAILEQAPFSRIASFGLSHPAKWPQATSLKLHLLGVPYLNDAWIASVEPGLRALTNRGRAFECDLVACGFGLVPNIELPQLLGCRIDDGFVAVDSLQRTSKPGIYCAGEIVAIGGLDLAIASGLIAGYAAAGQPGKARSHFAARDRALRFAHSLSVAFALRDELRSLASSDTIVCRCEDIKLGEVRAHDSSRAAKLHSRCGMGACQARTCGPALEFLLGFDRPAPRPPLFPARAGDLMASTRVQAPSPCESADSG
jgi:NADPH-dependent 2,4-dienoyl-CoA reductase/sulfur reductase-like enzyme